MPRLTKPQGSSLTSRRNRILSKNGEPDVRRDNPFKGLYTVKMKVGGVEKPFYYAWRGRGAPRIMAEKGTPEFLLEFVEAHKRRTKPAAGTFFTLIAEFRGSAEFPESESSQRAYLAYLREIEDRFGDLPLAALSNPSVRGDFLQWRDERKDKPRTADYAMSVLARVLSFGKNRGRITINPCEKIGRLYGADRTEKVWGADQIKKFCAVASDELQVALMLALWTGQRQGDLLRLTWNNYDGERIRLRQSKSKRRGKAPKTVMIPVGGPLKDLLDAERKAHGKKRLCVLANTLGEQWTSDGFRSSWAKACDRAKIEGLTFHDLRGTAVTRLALAGCTVPEIASITGHSLKDVEAILDAHYLGGRVELAEAAVIKLNTAYGSGM